jgi:hypothetical protein
MSVTAILLPLFVQVALTFMVLARLGMVRAAAVRADDFDKTRVLVDEDGWPVMVRQASNCFRNQFELPVLFYLVVTLALVTRKADIGFVVLAWIFALSRIAHAYVHVTSNRISWRFPLYCVGVVALFMMWVLFMLAILFAPVLP